MRTLTPSVCVLAEEIGLPALLITSFQGEEEWLKNKGRNTSQTELLQASPGKKWKATGRAAGRILPGPRGRGALRPAQDSGLGHPTLRDRYLVEMRIPGDIVSALLQGHRTRQARLGVAVSGGRGGCPAPDGAAGLAGQESHPRAAAQRRTHGPCADLPRGETKVRGAARPAGTYARRGAQSLSQGCVRRIQAAQPLPLPRGHLRDSLPALAARRPRQAPGKAKASSGSRSRAGNSPRHLCPSPREKKRRLRGKDSPHLQSRSVAVARLGLWLPQPTCAAPGAESTRPGCGAGGARRCGAVSLLPMNVPRPRPREREAGALRKERSGNLCSQCGVSLRVRVESLTARCSASAVPK